MKWEVVAQATMNFDVEAATRGEAEEIALDLFRPMLVEKCDQFEVSCCTEQYDVTPAMQAQDERNAQRETGYPL